MTEVFLNLFNRSITAGWIVLAVLLLRLCLRKAPKWVNCALWCVVALRLLLPFTLESAISLIPSPQVIPQDIAISQSPAIHSAIPAVNNIVNPVFTSPAAPESHLLQQILFVAAIVWVSGVGIMLLYSLCTYINLRLQVRSGIVYQKNVYVCDDVDSPFILGTIRPRIYLPSGMEEAHLAYVLAHESAHLKRWDHWWKPLGFLLLTLHWFNPLLWVGYICLCRDIEMACDEKVIANMDGTGKMGYSEALVACSVHRRLVMACPVAFGELSVKARIKRVLCYKKPGFWVALVAVAVCIFVAVTFLTDPVPCEHNYRSRVSLASTCTTRGVEDHTCPLCKHSYTTYIDMCAHNYDQFLVNREATCTAEGLGTRICSGCGKEEQASIDIIPHTAGEPYIIQEPTCTQTGTRSATCSVCQAVFVAEVLETNNVHDLHETVTLKPTCTAAGEGAKTCSRCGFSEAVSYEALGHSYKDGLYMRPTCRAEGGQQKVCTVCNHEVWTSVPKVDCSWSKMDYEYSMCRWCGSIKRNDGRSYSLLDGMFHTSATATPESLLPVIKIWP